MSGDTAATARVNRITGADSGTVGTLTIGGPAAFGNGSVYYVDIGAGAGNADKLGISGAATITSGATISIHPLSALDQAKYVLATAAGNYEFGEVEADQFFRLFGDGNGDRLVDAAAGSADLSMFAATYGKRTGQIGFNDIFDYDGDGDVDGTDLACFRSQRTKKMLFS